MSRSAFALAIVLASAAAAAAQVNYSVAGSLYSQDFDTLLTSGSGGWTNDTTLRGWSLFEQTGGGTAITTYTASNGGSGTGSFYSFGTGTATERALGGVASGGAYFGSPATGAVAGWIAVAINNATGGTLTDVNILYDGEQWRNGGNTNAQTMVLEYGIGASFTTVGTWTAPGAAFDFTSLVNTATAAALDGNLPANRTANLGGAISSLAWNNGDTLWVRWIERNDTGNDHGLAVDNFRFTGTFAAVPEPATVALLGLAGASGVALFRRRRAANAAKRLYAKKN